MNNQRPTRLQTDHQASWISIATLAVGSFALVTTELLPVGLLPQIAHGIGVTQGHAGLMVTMPGFIAAFAAPLSIVFAAGIDRRKILLGLLAILIASDLVVATSTGPVQLLAGRALLGIAIGGFWTLAGTLGSRLREGAEGTRANAVILSGVSLGTVAGVPAGALVGNLFGWRAAFEGAAGLAALAIISLFALLPSIPAEKNSGLNEVRAVLAESPARIGLAASMLIFVGQFVAYTYVTPFLNQRSGIHGAGLSALLLVSGAAGFFGNLAGGAISSRDIRTSMLVMTTLLGGSVLLLDLTGQSMIAAVALVIVWGFSFGMIPIATQSWLLSVSGGRLEGMQGLFVSLTQAAIAAGALVGGVIVDHAGLSAAFLTGSIAAFLTALIAGIATSRKSEIRQVLQRDLSKAL